MCVSSRAVCSNPKTVNSFENKEDRHTDVANIERFQEHCCAIVTTDVHIQFM